MAALEAIMAASTRMHSATHRECARACTRCARAMVETTCKAEGIEERACGASGSVRRN
jgi:hypothetical protein